MSGTSGNLDAGRSGESGPAPLVLYHTSACHLCELAEALLRERGLPYLAVDVVGDDALLAAYGIRIPVVRRPDGEELGWPFDGAALAAFVASGSA